MIDKAFKPGDVVRVRSGSEEMTVYLDNGGDSEVRCQWVEGGKKRTGTFHRAVLEPASNPLTDEDEG